MSIPNDRGARQGYLLLADISGYTAFLTGTELEHAHAIIHELTTLIRERLVPPMRFVKLEGDAVFCYADAATFREGERLIEVIEACYFAFSNRLLDMTRATTCRCDACAAIPSLGLKFVTHYGSFVVEHDAGREDLAGPDVILVHRLLKNSISDGGGPQAYAFFTEACLQRMPPSFNLPAHSEAYESFGETAGGVHDLEPVADAMREERREYIASADADLEMGGESPVPPSVIWQYWVDPEKRLRWQSGQTAIDNQPNQSGRLGAGATSHCAHGVIGDVLREYLDWRPFSYYTNRMTPIGRGIIGRLFLHRSIETTEFIPLENGGTLAQFRIRLQDRGWLARLRFQVTKLILLLGQRRTTEALRRALEEDGVVPGLDETGEP
ncbi:MAG: DUF2652 domain-containing protein [Dehalococcoidia bacterium]